MGTVWADAALSGQTVLSISARLYSQSMVAQSVPCNLSSNLQSFTVLQIFAVV